jgi:hypothetical protein
LSTGAVGEKADVIHILDTRREPDDVVASVPYSTCIHFVGVPSSGSIIGSQYLLVGIEGVAGMLRDGPVIGAVCIRGDNSKDVGG